MRKGIRTSRMGIGGVALASLCLLGTAPPVDSGRPSDVWITVATNMALIRAQGVDGASIGAGSVDGVVTLYGMVGTRAEKTRASVVASRIPGVEGVRNVLTVASAEHRAEVVESDSRAAARLTEALAVEPSLEGIGVRAVSDGIAILAGEATSLATHRRALDVAEEVEGVRSVTSVIRSPDAEGDAAIWEETGPQEDLEPRSGFRTALSDAWIETRLTFRLMADPRLLPTAVDVDAREGIVTLFGTVETQEDRRAAEDRALGVNGVLFVDNELQVVPDRVAESVAEEDERLETAVEQSLEAERLEDADISVEVRNATARLTGSVASRRDRAAAFLAAGATRGVRGVSDGLEVDEPRS